ncbi:hypothetical protein RB653_004354 [Dictyostelium firmibasis]|uniref:Cytochrome P450 n=1 Tax=Dictyostelium firmibasis TaxID=79012 RepID=A0AAN7UJ51_9MYCE
MNYFFLFFLTIILLFLDFVKKNLRKSKKDPPGPISLPVIGNLHNLTKNPHRGLKNLSDKYGEVFRCYLGDHYSIVVCNRQIINEIYVKNFENFCSRPYNDTFKMFSGDFKDLAFANNYSDWKNIRSMVNGNFTKTNLTKTIYNYLEDQTIQLINNMDKYTISGEPFYPQKQYMKVSINIMCKLFFSKEVLPNESIDNGNMDRISVPIQIVCKELGAGNLDDFVGIISPFLFFTKKKYQKAVSKMINFIEEIYEEHLNDLDEEKPKDLMDMLIIDSKGNNKKGIVHVGFDFLLGGSDSSSGIMEWFTLFMSNNKEYQEKAYNEIVSVMGKNCHFISYNDRPKLPYLVACINECLRMRAEDPLGIPRVAIEDIEIKGFFIPKGTQIHHNLYAVGMNEKVFENPNKFDPERWLTTDQDILKERLNHLIPFSVGPRVCIGKNLSELETFVVCANILLNFEFSSYTGEPIDDIEIFGITIHPPEFPVKLIKRK